MSDNTGQLKEVQYWMAAPWVKMAKEYAQWQMGDRPRKLNWDRKDPDMVALFYCHMLEFLHKNYDITPKK